MNAVLTKSRSKFRASFKRLNVACALVALGFLAGCGDQRLDLVMGDDRNSTHTLAVADTARAFVEGPATARSARAPSAPAARVSSSGGLFDIDPEFLSPGGDVNRQLAVNVGLGLRHQTRVPLGRRTALYARTTAALGKTRYDLPEGFGAVLPEPAEVTLTSLTLEPEVGLARDWQIGAGRSRGAVRGRLTTSAGVGVQFSQTHTTIRSTYYDGEIRKVFLDVKHHSVNAQPYLALGASVQPAWTPVTLDLQARIARDGMTQIRTELALPLGAGGLLP